MKKSLLLFGFTITLLFGYQYWRHQAAYAHTGDLLQTFPAIKDQYTFVFLGDFGSGTENQDKIFSSIEQYCLSHGIDGIFLLGDNVYMNGVYGLDDPKLKSIIEVPFSRPCISKVNKFPILGNHDYKGNANTLIEYSLVNKTWKFPNRFYSVAFGNLFEVIALDTEYLDFCGNWKKCGLDFLLDRKRHSKAKWKIAIGHHPASSSSSKYHSGIIGNVLKTASCGLNSYISGHSHHLEHLKLNNCDTDYFISGGGGADLYPIDKVKVGSRFAASAYGFLSLEVSKSTIKYSFIDPNGKVIYHHSPLEIARR